MQVTRRRGSIVLHERPSRTWLKHLVARFETRTGAALGSWPAALSDQRRILIHAGLHKTGTTALQEFLSSVTVKLREQNVLYPSAGRPAELPDAHHNIAWQLA